MRNRYSSFAAVLLAIGILTCLLYVPFLNSGLIFDDHGLFSTLIIYDYAQIPFDFKRRTFPYFTLGMVQVLTGNIEANRIFSLILHIACSGVVFLLTRTFLKQVLKTSDFSSREREQGDTRILLIAAFGAAWFAVHPVAVYGAAYLAQRTILFATLFSLVSLLYFQRALTTSRTADILTAAFFYSAAVYSKEHAIMLPLVALALFVTLHRDGLQLHIKKISLYLLLCVPAALGVLVATKDIVGTSYEPRADAMLSLMHSIPLVDSQLGQWVVSVVIQAQFFFQYLMVWVVPDVHMLSLDMRFDFVHIWFAWWTFPAAVIFFLSPIIAICCSRRSGLIALFCCGFLYCWILFLTELVSVRFQEPFVLYRSYLWAPGYVLMLVAILYSVRTRWLLACSIPIFVLFIFLARDRLESLATEDAVWSDAAAKLESSSLPGSDRIFYNRGLAYLKGKRFEEAVGDFTVAIRQSPKIFQLYYQRGIAYYSLGEFNNARADFDRAISLNNKDGASYYGLGKIFERRGCFNEAVQAYTKSQSFGVRIATVKINDLEKQNRKSEVSLSPCGVNRKSLDE